MRVAASTVFGVALGDLPVHCLRHEVTGSWTFHLSEASAERSACGHQSPDAPSKQPAIDLDEFAARKLKVQLDAPQLARTEDTQGTWSMIYDEGFEVHLGTTKFLAFNKFDGSVDADGNLDNYKSFCHETQVGWYHDTAKDHFGCWVGTRAAAPSFVQTKSKSKRQQISISADGRAEVFIRAQEEDVMTEQQHQQHVDKINSVQDQWSATTYAHLMNKTRSELNLRSGIPRAGKSNLRPDRTSFLQTADFQADQESRIAKLPQDFDWRNKDGKDYVGLAVDQGECGSCYVHAAIGMLSSRKRIVEDNPEAEGFSLQFPLFCSEYNQGCGGGFPELIAKWSQDVGLVPESCSKYDLESQKCGVTCDMFLHEKWRVSDYGYTSGFYGAQPSVADMMEEVHKRGPIAVALEPTDDFMYYSSGIFSHAAVLFDEWAKVDHAVLLTGWGEEDGKKYWRVQNSWGADWGEQGTFRIARGDDESAIEAQGVWATVEKTPELGNLAAYVQA
mmetsp:Transcript_68833/g.183334  ORF Transcript_68833/g.183334 Transcript_68833/m.183334 type:complete len:503 (+) Transcript_68833:606-2114(+)